MPLCSCVCYTYVAYNSHVEICHQCIDCAVYVNNLLRHACPQRGQGLGQIGAGQPLDLSDFAEVSRSQRGAVALYRYRGELDTKLVDEVFATVEQAASKLLTELYTIHNSMKIEVILGVLMERKQKDEDGHEYFQQEVMYFVSKHEMLSLNDIDQMLLSSASEIFVKLEEFLENASDWYIKGMKSFEIKQGELRLFQNARGKGFIEFPIKGRRGYQNLRAAEPICFNLSVCASLFWNEQKLLNERNGLKRGNLKCVGTWKKYMKRLDWSDITPVLDIYKNLDKFEQKNYVSVNIFTEHKQEVVLMRKSEFNYPNVANLFLIVKKKKNNKYDTHYVAVTDIHMFLGKAWSKRRAWFCLRCFRRFGSQKTMQQHYLRCIGPKEFKPFEKLPSEDEVITFKKFEMSLEWPVCFFVDFETFSVPVPESERQKGANTILNYRYEPASYALCAAVQDGETFNIENVEYFDGPNPASHFLRRVFELAEKYLHEIRTTNNFIQPTPEELLEFEAATECHFCHREFTNVAKVENEEADHPPSEPMDWSGDDLSDIELESLPPLEENSKPVYKCYHHRHWDGKYLFALCHSCNLRIKYKHEVPVIAHGGSNFDFHLILANLDPKIVNFQDIRVLAKSSEKIIEITMTKNNDTLPPLIGNYASNASEPVYCGTRTVKIRMLDNCNYLGSSLDALSSSLSKDGCRFWHMLTQSLPAMLPHLNNYKPSYIDLLLKKLPYCYQYLSSPKVLEPGHPLPPREKWDNELKKHKVTDAEWELIQTVCTELQIKDLKTFTHVYCVLDTVLLCIINTNFRSICMELYKLDPLYNCTLSGFSWQAFLHMTGVKINHIRDRKMLKLVTDSIRGGIVFNSKTYVEANNPLLPDHDSSKEDNYIVYYDVNR